jgi:hypothetical protein
MPDRDDDEALRVTFEDIRFLRRFFKNFAGADSLKEVAKRLGYEDSAQSFHHRLSRALEHLGYESRIYDKIKMRLTREGQDLEEWVRTVWETAAPGLPTRSRRARKPVYLAMPEVMTGRSFSELIGRLWDHGLGEDLDLVTRRMSPKRLADAATNSRGRDDLVMTLSAAPDPNAKAKAGAKRTAKPSSSFADLQRVLIVRNSDPLVVADRTVGLSRTDIGKHPIYLPPIETLWPGFDLPWIEDAPEVHRVASFFDAHAYALNIPGALAAAHPETLDEVEDKLCRTLPLGIGAGRTRLQIHRIQRDAAESGPRADLIGRVLDVIAEHLEDLSTRADKAQKINESFANFSWMAYTSNAPGGDGISKESPEGGWHWKYSKIEDLHVTALGHLKGRQGPLEPGFVPRPDLEFEFDLFGRIMDDNRGKHHLLWRSVDHLTRANDRGPRVEHFSVNIVFSDDDLTKRKILTGLWTGRRSGPDLWVPGCGVVVLADRELSPDALRREVDEFRRDRLQLGIYGI